MLGEHEALSTFVICGECGSSIFLDPENIVRQDHDTIVLRCRNNCCGHVGSHTLQELRTRPSSYVIDHTANLLFH